MTTYALNNLWNYLQGLSLSRSDLEWLAGKLIEPIDKTSAEVEENAEEKTYEVIPVSPKLQWLRMHITATPEWNRQEAWNRLTDKQREEAMRLNLSAEDMDERTFYFIQKHMK